MPFGIQDIRAIPGWRGRCPAGAGAGSSDVKTGLHAPRPPRRRTELQRPPPAPHTGARDPPNSGVASERAGRKWAWPRSARPGRALRQGCNAGAAGFRCAPPRRASCGLARPCCHVGLCGRRRRLYRRSGLAGRVARLVAELEKTATLGPELRRTGGPGAAFLPRCPPGAPAAGSSLPWPPLPGAGGAARCGASDSPPPAPVTEKGDAGARPLARGHGPGRPTPPAAP